MMTPAVKPRLKELKQGLFQFDFFLLQKLTAVKQFIALMQQKTAEVFHEQHPQKIQFSISAEDWQKRMHRLRQNVRLSSDTYEAFTRILTETGIKPGEVFIDAVRIRGVPHNFHLEEMARPVSFVHRDQWYANPQAQINWWLPVYDVTENMSFHVYPHYRHRPVMNTSARFDYNDWLMKGGFQAYDPKKEQNKIFPEPLEPLNETGKWQPAANAGEAVLFSPHELHGTAPNTSGITRFTIEVRMVFYEDIINRAGAPNLDNASTGSTLVDFFEPFTGERFDIGLVKKYIKSD